MALEVEKASSFDDLQSLVLPLLRCEGSCYFRGQSLASWQLVPTIDRDAPANAPVVHRLQEEKDLLQQFVAQTQRHWTQLERLHAAGIYDPNAYVPALALMQHHGGPTRLLDWSMSPWVASYFACLTDSTEDAAVWWVKSAPLQKAVGEQWDRLGWPHVDDRYPRPRGERVFVPECPRFISPVHLHLPFSRAEAQQSAFTIAAPLGTPHDEILQEIMPAGSFGKIVIGGEIKHAVLVELARRSINAITLQYPAMDLAGQQLKYDLICQREEEHGRW